MNSLQPLIKDAEPPYDSTAVADTILRSSDNIDFYVVLGLLRLVSPFFRDIFDLNRGTAVEQNEMKDGFPVIPLMDDSKTLRLLLDFFHPRVEEPQLDDVTLFWNVSKAAKKYCMDIIEGKLIARITTSKLLNEEPLRIYVIATDLEWEDVASIAARKTLGTPLKNLTYVEELQSVSGAVFYRFLEYRLRCDASDQPGDEQLSVAGAQMSNLIPPSTHDASSGVPSDGFEPFRSSSMADLILRSSDSVDFFVIAALIRLVSPVFNEMFPLKEHQNKDGRPVIPVQESSQVILPLLRIIYHDMHELDIEDCQLYRDIVLTVRKYRMTSIERKLQKQITASSLILDEPLRIYILATMLGWADVQKVAAFNSLLQPLQGMTYIPELDLVTGADLYRLVHFRFRCGDRACATLDEDGNFSSHGVGSWDSYRTDSRSGYYFSRSIRGLDWNARLRACPRGPTMTYIYSQKMEEAQRNGFYYNFASSFPRILKSMRDAEKLVEEAVSKVRFTFVDAKITHLHPGPSRIQLKLGLGMFSHNRLKYGRTIAA